ncbi:SDR family oxidoreductase [Sphingomonas sp. Tas61C01]|uniref:SDR family oxidoreductase n=1 Tax=Sphingomonas sp. Tas61C01 TaxID=3458297 RepID=UPI00403EEB92
MHGKRVLLTGGLGSLGRAQARMLVGCGARLLLLDVADPAQARPEVERIGTDGPGDVVYLQQDLGDLEGARAAVAAAVEVHGGVDVLINNAATIVNRPFEQFTLAEYEEQMRVNAGAAFALAQAVAPSMKAQGEGVVVNFSSVTLSGAWDGYVPYVASKGAVVGLTKALARELGPFGIRVNAVSPGAVVSEAEERVFGERAEAYACWVLDRQCLKRRIEPDDVAAAVLFLASDAARMISGHVLHVDAGW